MANINRTNLGNGVYIQWINPPKSQAAGSKNKTEDLGLNGKGNFNGGGDSLSLSNKAEGIIYDKDGKVIGHATLEDGKFELNGKDGSFGFRVNGDTLYKDISLDGTDGSSITDKLKTKFNNDGSVNTFEQTVLTDSSGNRVVNGSSDTMTQEQVNNLFKDLKANANQTSGSKTENATTAKTNNKNNGNTMKDLYAARHITTEQAAKSFERTMAAHGKNSYAEMIVGSSDAELKSLCADLAKGNWDEDKTKLAKAIIESLDSRLSFSTVEKSNTTELQKNLHKIWRKSMADIDGKESTKNKRPYGEGTTQKSINDGKAQLANADTTLGGTERTFTYNEKEEISVADVMKKSGYEPVANAEPVNSNKKDVKVYRQQFKNATGDIKTVETTIDTKNKKVTRTIENGELSKSQKAEIDKNTDIINQDTDNTSDSNPLRRIWESYTNY